MRFLKTLAALLFSTITGNALAGESASFDPNTNTLTMPFVKLDGNARYQSVVIQLQNMGQLQLDDASVSDAIEFITSGNILRLPQVTVGGTTYSRVSLTGPTFTISSVGGVLTVDAGTSGSYTLDIVVSAMGMAIPTITVTNVPKPSTQDEFCNAPEMQNRITQAAQGLAGSWTLNSCSFNGTTGNIAMTLTISAMNMVLPYSAQYTYR